MHKLYELKDMLCEELEEYGSKGKLDVGSLDVVDKLAHAIKNIDKIIECKEDENYSGDMMVDGMHTDYGRSYARGRGRNARRDAMGRYASRGESYRGYSRAESDFREDLRDLMNDAPNDNIRQKIKSIMSDM